MAFDLNILACILLSVPPGPVYSGEHSANRLFYSLERPEPCGAPPPKAGGPTWKVRSLERPLCYPRLFYSSERPKPCGDPPESGEVDLESAFIGKTAMPQQPPLPFPPGFPGEIGHDRTNVPFGGNWLRPHSSSGPVHSGEHSANRLSKQLWQRHARANECAICTGIV